MNEIIASLFQSWPLKLDPKAW